MTRYPSLFTAPNPEFGGRNRARLFVCASRSLLAIHANTGGAERLPTMHKGG